ncbi:MAG: hypothetical protein HGA45_07665 [Chloroflexales bacterium]|nr:hypothetical protein [Chloroflexales bacterium]
MDDDQPSPDHQVIARRSGARTVSQRLVRFQCAWCGEPVIELRYPGPTPAYGLACRDEATRYADAVKAARRRGTNPPPRLVTTSCLGSPSNRYQADADLEPKTAEIIVRAATRDAVRAALKSIEALLTFEASSQVAITAASDNTWEARIALRLPRPPAGTDGDAPAPPQPQDVTVPPDPPDLASSDEDHVAGLAYEIGHDLQSIGSDSAMIADQIQALIGGAALGVRRGKALIEDLEGLLWVWARLTVYRAIATGQPGTSTSTAAADEAARAYGRTYRQVRMLYAQLVRERSLRGQPRFDLITIAQRLCAEAQALAAAITAAPVTNAAIAWAIWEGLEHLEQVQLQEQRPQEADDTSAPARKSKPVLNPGLVDALSLHGGGKRHLTANGWETLCGRLIEGDWEEEQAFRRTDCKRCRLIARRRLLTCLICKKPLLEQGEPHLCPRCSTESSEPPPERWW